MAIEPNIWLALRSVIICSRLINDMSSAPSVGLFFKNTSTHSASLVLAQRFTVLSARHLVSMGLIDNSKSLHKLVVPCARSTLRATLPQIRHRAHVNSTYLIGLAPSSPVRGQ